MRKLWIIFVATALFFSSCSAENKVIWKIGENNNSGAEFALAPSDYARFIEKDFGWEDKFYLIHNSAVYFYRKK